MNSPAFASCLAALEKELTEARVRGGYVVARCAAPGALGSALLRATDAIDTNEGRRVSFSPWNETDSPTGKSSFFLGLGSAVEIRVEGPERFDLVREAARALTARLEPTSADDPVHSIRFWGGASFASGTNSSETWRDFGDALFFVPELTYAEQGDSATFTLFTTAERGRLVLDRLRALFERIDVEHGLDVASTNGTASETATRIVERSESLSRDEFCELVERIRTGIGEGEFEKVVLSRRSSLKLTHTPRPSELWERLGELAPRCSSFLLTVGDRHFIGATPERLVEKTGAEMRTEALAGSISAALPGAAERLLASEKDRAEHAFVVTAVLDALRPLCATLEVSDTPIARPLRNILHLKTPIVGRLSSDVHVLDLVERLHPTPAVGGSPRAAACSFLAHHEHLTRGFYAGPFGWMDLRGDGEFVVALRSALLDETHVDVFAGAGIVRGSHPDEEFSETELKMSNMLHALGLPI